MIALLLKQWAMHAEDLSAIFHEMVASTNHLMCLNYTSGAVLCMTTRKIKI